MLVLKNERLIWKQLCARNKVFNRLRALYRKPSFSIAFNTSGQIKKYFCALTFNQATWLTYRERGVKWVTAMRITLIIFELANLQLDELIEGQVYPWVRRWRLISLVHIYTTYSPNTAKLSLRLFTWLVTSFSSSPRPKPLSTTTNRRSFVWCFMEKLSRNNGLFLDTLTVCCSNYRNGE